MDEDSYSLDKINIDELIDCSLTPSLIDFSVNNGTCFSNIVVNPSSMDENIENNNNNSNSVIFESFYDLTEPSEIKIEQNLAAEPACEQNVYYLNEMTNQSKLKTKKDSNEKPPEPYADIIVKAILSSKDNVMQLKDIYKYMIDNYEFFANNLESNKWRNSVRYNLSGHKYFTKTSQKNAHGHFWSIHPSYIKLLKDGLNDSKPFKKLKVATKKPQKKSKNNTQKVKNSAQKSSQCVGSTSVSYSPTVSSISSYSSMAKDEFDESSLSPSSVLSSVSSYSPSYSSSYSTSSSPFTMVKLMPMENRIQNEYSINDSAYLSSNDNDYSFVNSAQQYSQEYNYSYGCQQQQQQQQQQQPQHYQQQQSCIYQMSQNQSIIPYNLYD